MIRGFLLTLSGVLALTMGGALITLLAIGLAEWLVTRVPWAPAFIALLAFFGWASKRA